MSRYLSRSFNWLKQQAGFGGEGDNTDDLAQSMSLTSANIEFDRSNTQSRSVEVDQQGRSLQVPAPGATNYQGGLFHSQPIDRERGDFQEPLSPIAPTLPADGTDGNQTSVSITSAQNTQTAVSNSGNITGSQQPPISSESNENTDRFAPTETSTPYPPQYNQLINSGEIDQSNMQIRQMNCETAGSQMTRPTADTSTVQNQSSQTYFSAPTQAYQTANSMQTPGSQISHSNVSANKSLQQNNVMQNTQSQSLTTSASNTPHVSFQLSNAPQGNKNTKSSDLPKSPSPIKNNESSQFRPTFRKVMMPEHYDGESDWEEYISAFIDIADWNCWSYEEKSVQLGLHLSGIARTIKTDLPHSITKDFDLFVLTLGKYFSCEGREAAYQAEYRQRRRGTNEKLSDFGHELSRLCKKAFPKLERSAREQFVLEHFKLGLDPDLRKHVQFSHPDTLEEAIVTGLEFEAMDDERTKAKKPTNVSAYAVTTTDTPQNSVDNMTKLVEQNQQLIESIQKLCQKSRTPIDQVICFHCNKKGHYRNKCPTRQEASSSSKSSTTSPLN